MDGTKLKRSDRTLEAQAPNTSLEAHTFTSSTNGRLYIVLRHLRPSEGSYAYYVLESTDTFHFTEVQVQASAKAFLGVQEHTPDSDWWDIWPERLAD